MGNNTDPEQDYLSARTDFDARWEAALRQTEPSEIRIGESLSQEALLESFLTQIRELASACADRGLIDPQGRDAVHAAVRAIHGAFAGIAREDLAEVMYSTRAGLLTQTPQTPPNP